VAPLQAGAGRPRQPGQLGGLLLVAAIGFSIHHVHAGPQAGHADPMVATGSEQAYAHRLSHMGQKGFFEVAKNQRAANC